MQSACHAIELSGEFLEFVVSIHCNAMIEIARSYQYGAFTQGLYRAEHAAHKRHRCCQSQQ